MLPKDLILFCVFSLLYYKIQQCSTISVSFISTERPIVTYINPLFLRNVSVYSRRHNRKDPRYYMSIFAELLIPIDNTIMLDFYFYQLLTNRYRPSFVELHFRFCDMVEKDPIFGSQFKKHLKLMNVTCPYPPRYYALTDMAIPFVPKNFPFRQGRIYANCTKHINNNTEILVNGYIDMEIKDVHLNNKKS